MFNSFVRLTKPRDIDTKGWDIDFHQLLTPKRSKSPYVIVRDEFYEDATEAFGCLFYTIYEYRMGFEAALVAIYANKQCPRLLANPKNQWFDFQGVRSYVFSDNYLFLRKLAYNSRESYSGTPFIAFDLLNHCFGFVDFDFTSVYYSPVKVQEKRYRFNLDSPEELRNLNSTSGKSSQSIDLMDIKMYPFTEVDNILDLYFKEKKMLG